MTIDEALEVVHGMLAEQTPGDKLAPFESEALVFLDAEVRRLRKSTETLALAVEEFADELDDTGNENSFDLREALRVAGVRERSTDR